MKLSAGRTQSMIPVSRILGGVLVLSGIAFNKWTLEAAVIFDGSIDSAKAGFAIAAAQMVTIGVGAWMLIRAPRFSMPSVGNSVLVVVSTVFAVATNEVALRLTQTVDAQDAPAYVGQYENRKSLHIDTDSQTGWRMRKNHEFQWSFDGRPSTYRSNSQGFRSDRDFETAPESMIAMIGDSFTWGTGVDYVETFGDLLEKKLSGSTVYNFAMPGFGIDQMWMSARHQALPLRPVLVVVGFIDEDFDRSLTAYRRFEGFNKPRFVLESGRLRPQTPADAPGWFLKTVQSSSRMWNMAANAYDHLRPFGEAWVLNTAILEAIAADCKEHGVPLLIVRVPEKRKSPVPFKTLAEHLRSKDIEFLDLGGPGAPPDIHFKNDGHINAKGHQYVGEAIAGWIGANLPQLARN
jgi:hypothetical protein